MYEVKKQLKKKLVPGFYSGLNQQPNLLGKINPPYVLSYIYPALVGLLLTQCFFFRVNKTI